MKEVLLAIQMRLQADAAIAAKVQERVFRWIPADPQYPFIAVARIDAPPSPGESSETSTWGTARIQCTTFTKPTPPGDADSYELSELIAESLSTERDEGVQNEYLDPGGTRDLVYVSHIEDLGPDPDYSDGAPGGIGVFRDHRDFIVHYKL